MQSCMGSTMKFTAFITVGPHPEHRRWLRESVYHAVNQTHPPDELLIIDDQAHLSLDERLMIQRMVKAVGNDMSLTTHHTLWLSGIAHVLNFGVALARYPLVAHCASDDTWHPTFIERCLEAFETNARNELCFYWVDQQVGQDRQSVPAGAGMWTKALWAATGGFPPMSAVGGEDSVFVSLLQSGKTPATLYHVLSPEPLVNFRLHECNSQNLIIPEAMELVRERVLASWNTPQWTPMS